MSTTDVDLSDFAIFDTNAVQIDPIFEDWKFAGKSRPYNAAETQNRLQQLATVPRMSTWTIAALFNHAVSCLDNNLCYVNIGVWHGFSFLAGLVGNPGKRCIGVDNFSQLGGPAEEFLQRFRDMKGPAHTFFEMDYEQYLTTVHKTPIGLYFYDGHHSYEHQFKGLQLAESYFADGCLIIVDDTNTEPVRRATKAFVKQSHHTYQTILDQTTTIYPDPTYWNGIMVLRKTV